MLVQHALSFWVVSEQKGNHVFFSSVPHLPDAISMWTFPFQVQSFFCLKLFENCSEFDSLKMNHLRCRRWEAKNTESKGGKKRGKSPGSATLQDLFWYSIPVARIFHMLLSDPLRKATELPKAHFLLHAYVAGQPLLSQSPPKPGSVTQKDIHAKLRLLAFLAKGSTQASQQSKPQYSGTKELCFHKKEYSITNNIRVTVLHTHLKQISQWECTSKWADAK